ncbi:MAG: NAD-binding protein [Anaerolineales bacterium]
MSLKMIVVGCGRLGANLAYRLYKQKYQVVVIDNNAAAFDNLPNDFQGRTIEGDALNYGLLEQADITESHGLAAVTNADTVNAIVGKIARDIYRVSYIVVRNYETHYREMQETFGVQIVSSTAWGAQRIEEMMFHGEMFTISSAGNGEVEIYEISIPIGGNGKPLSALMPEEQCIPVALTRSGRAFIPTRDTILQTNDLVQISATFEGSKILRQRLNQMTEA